MNIFVLNQNFETVDIIDSYESAIWTDRYCGFGDCEIYTFFDPSIIQKVRQDYYLLNLESEHLMIVEGIQIDSDAESGNHLRITGRSLESILNRRIVWQQTSVTGSLQNALKSLITASIISPSIADRQISNFVFEDSTDPDILAATLEAQYTGDNIYDIVVSACETYNFGFKVTLNNQNQFVFKLYKGEDRSYDQMTNPYVVFSPSFENIINSNYVDSTEVMKNVTLVAGEDQGEQRRTLVVGAGTGLARRELYTDARDIQSEKVTNYNEALRQRGLEQLIENSRTVSFEGQVEATKMFVYGTDFFMGDIIQIANEYGIEGAARVVEFIHSEDANGLQMYPTFEAIQDIDTTTDDLTQGG